MVQLDSWGGSQDEFCTILGPGTGVIIVGHGRNEGLNIGGNWIVEIHMFYLEKETLAGNCSFGMFRM